MTDLDGLDLEQLDPEGMLGTIERSGEMWRAAIDRARQLTADRVERPPAAVLVAGMGGSGIAGDVGALAADLIGSTPVVPAKGYELPRWAGPDHLVVAVSYSGNTEETLALVDEARGRGCRIAAVTSGGQLAERGASSSWLVVRIPDAGHPPRANLPYLAAAVLGILTASRALPDTVWDEADGVPDAVERRAAKWAHDVPTERNEAKAAAHTLHGRIPVLYGGRGVGALAAQRGKCQINENAGQPAFHGEIPERDHNEIVGWGGDTERLAVLELRSVADEHPQMRRRFAAAEPLVDVPRVRVDLAGRSWLERFADGALFVDLVSVYLAFLYGVDPTPVTPIETLKREISTESTHA